MITKNNALHKMTVKILCNIVIFDDDVIIKSFAISEIQKKNYLCAKHQLAHFSNKSEKVQILPSKIFH